MSLESEKVHLPRDYPLGAVVAVVYRSGKFLTITRSQFVKAPGTVCFAGGGVEIGETQSVAIVREMQEELNVDVKPLGLVWSGKTDHGVELNFWQVTIGDERALDANPEEVESFSWQSATAMRADPNLLDSAVRFLDAWDAGEISLVENS